MVWKAIVKVFYGFGKKAVRDSGGEHNKYRSVTRIESVIQINNIYMEAEKNVHLHGKCGHRYP